MLYTNCNYSQAFESILKNLAKSRAIRGIIITCDISELVKFALIIVFVVLQRMQVTDR